jgi:hypothetical protein
MRKNAAGNIAGVFQLPKIQQDAGNLYVHFARFAEWLNVFGEEKHALVQLIGNSLLLDIKTTETGVVLNGFSSDKTGSLFSIFKNQVPTGLGI